MSFLSRTFLLFGLVFFLVASLVQGGLFDKKKDEDDKYTGKDNAELGFRGLQDSCTYNITSFTLCTQGRPCRSRILGEDEDHDRIPLFVAITCLLPPVRNPEALREVLQMANDPEMMKQAKVSRSLVPALPASCTPLRDPAISLLLDR